MAACVLRARRLKKVNFLRKKVHPVTWLEDFLTSKWPVSFTALAFAPDDLPHDLSDLEMTWLPWRPGAATAEFTVDKSSYFVFVCRTACWKNTRTFCVQLYVGLLVFSLRLTVCLSREAIDAIFACSAFQRLSGGWNYWSLEHPAASGEITPSASGLVLSCCKASVTAADVNSVDVGFISRRHLNAISPTIDTDAAAAVADGDLKSRISSINLFSAFLCPTHTHTHTCWRRWACFLP